MLKNQEWPGDEATPTLLVWMYKADLQQYVCETGVGVQINDSPPPYCTAVCNVQGPHFISFGLFYHLKTV